MKKYKVNILRTFVALISIIMVCGLAFVLPDLANYFEETAPEFAYLKKPLIAGIYFTGIPFFVAVYNVFKLFKMVEEGNIFNEKSLDSLKLISKCSISEIIIYGLGLIFLYLNNAMQPGIILISFLIMFTGFAIYIFIEILKELLIQVVEIKTENELTI